MQVNAEMNILDLQQKLELSKNPLKGILKMPCPFSKGDYTGKNI